jgi:hypothetical protein
MHHFSERDKHACKTYIHTVDVTSTKSKPLAREENLGSCSPQSMIEQLNMNHANGNSCGRVLEVKESSGLVGKRQWSQKSHDDSRSFGREFVGFRIWSWNGPSDKTAVNTSVFRTRVTVKSPSRCKAAFTFSAECIVYRYWGELAGLQRMVISPRSGTAL